MKKILFSATAVVALAAGSASAAVSGFDFTFDTQAAYDANFIKFNTTSHLITATGVGGSGALTAPGGGQNNKAYYSTSVGGFDSGETATYSAFFEIRTGTGFDNNNASITLNAATTNDPVGGQYIGARLDFATGRGSVALIGRESGGIASTSPDLTGGAGLVDSDFYKLVAEITETNTAAGTFSANLSLFNYGPDGTSAPVQIGSTFSTSLTGLVTAAADTTLFAGLSAGNGSNGGTRNLDNLSLSGAVVPEPASLVVVALGAIGTLRRRRTV